MAKGHKTGGRRPGAPNKLTADLRSMIEGALKTVGGEAYLTEQAKENPKAFMTLLSRLLPTNVVANVDNNGVITVRVIRETSARPEVAED